MVKKHSIPEVEKPIYTIISREDFETRFERSLGVLLLFQSKLSVVEKFVKEYENNKMAEIEYNFLNDNEGPPIKPIYIRQFLSKFTYADKRNKEKYNHWLCKVNETWLLRQPPLPENLSKDNVRKEFELLDNVLVKHITLCLKTLDKLRIFLQTKSVEISKYVDFKEVKDELILEIHHLLTKFMNQILFRTEHFMDTQDACTSKYDCDTELFQFGFWMLRNVPINLDDQFSKQEEVRLNSLKVKVSIPRSSLFENLVLRGIHWEADLYSETGHTFHGPPCILKKSKKLAYILILDHKTKLELIAAKKEECIEQRELYIDYLKKTNQFPVEEALPRIAVKPVVRPKKPPEVPPPKGGKSKKSNNSKLSTKPKEIITVPPEIGTNDLLDVEQEFLELEEARYLDYLVRLNPKSLDMEQFEVNQRQYIILGGVYEFEFVKKPDQIIYGNHIVMSNIGKHNNAEKTNIELESRNKSISMLMSEVFKITFKVPSHLSKWSTPLVCKWIPGEAEQLKKQDSNIHKEDIIEDFDLNSMLEPSQLDDIKKHLIPRIGSSSILPDRLLIETDIHYKLKAVIDEAMKYIERRRIPENLFTIFEAVPAVKVVSSAKKASLTKHETESKKFSDILRELEAVKVERKALLDKFQQHFLLKGGASSYRETQSKPHFPDLELLRSRAGGYLQHKPSRLGKYKKTDSQMSTQTNAAHKKETLHAEASRSKSGMIEAKHTRSRRKLKKHHHKKRIKSLEDEIVEDAYEEVSTTIAPKWSTRHIVKSVFDSEKSEITIWTKELGIYGFAFARYAHFPFFNWTMVPHHDDCSRIVVSLRSQFIQIEIEVTEDGYFPKVTDNQIRFKTVCYLQTEEPIENLALLKKTLQDNNFNIFPEKDAVIYIPDALEKHFSLEFHTYECMGLCCTYMQYCKSNWNKYAPRRICIIKCGDLREDLATLEDVKITPEEALFVTITTLPKELQSNEILLDYNPSWKNIRFSADLWILIQTSYATMINMSRPSKKPRLCHNVITLLKAIRPLSFSV